MVKSARLFLWGLSPIVWSLLASGGEAKAADGAEVVAPAGHGQKALALRAGAAGIVARVCAADPCKADGGAALTVPDELRARLGSARASSIELEGGRHLVRVDVPGADPGEAWVMLVAAPLASAKENEAKVLWSGFTGVSRGEHGEGRRYAVREEPAKTGNARRVLVGELRDDVTICGRPALVSAKEVDPEALSLSRGASAQSLSAAERAGAVKLTAARVAGGEERRAAQPVRALRARVASSAVERKFGTLTDGDPETAWSENKSGGGEGEFVSIASSPDVPIDAFEIVVRPQKEEIAGGAAPKTFYLAADDEIFAVAMPEDAWKQPPGTRYAIRLPKALRTSCVSLVLGEAYAPAGGKGAADAKKPLVTLAEVEARTAFDAMSLPALAGALAGGGDRAKGAAALLSSAGSAGVAAVVAVYDKLDDAGKLLARGVIEAAPCSDQVPFYAARLSAIGASLKKAPPPVGRGRNAELAHASDRLRRCGRAAAEELGRLVHEGKGATPLIAADELALIAPDAAIGVLLDALAKADDARRRELREALASAAKSPRAYPALAEELSASKLAGRSEVVKVDLLRAIGPSLGKVEGAAEAFAALSAPGASFRTRYLLLGPAADLANAGDKKAEEFLRASLLRDEDAHVRARAAEAAGKVERLRGDLVAAMDDRDPRVREAAINALGEALSKGGRAPRGLGVSLGRRLGGDAWTFVRTGAARAMGAMPKDAALDRALAAALEDASPEVRAQALDALGAHRASEYASQIRELSETSEESVEVRARAILALGAMCDTRSVGDWTKLAERLLSPMGEADRRLGSAAVAALGMVHPSDLRSRLAPLLQNKTPPWVRELAKAALENPGSCR